MRFLIYRSINYFEDLGNMLRIAVYNDPPEYFPVALEVRENSIDFVFKHSEKSFVLR